ncbi:MAG TPA: lysylphosphatidylglycerol synthase transmembrane domain-containing protein [Gaiellaceae bacterium]|nr:lysylphosphatidylglycerol synthase transmembrane domain-containing protein [Gaiellaceae bacterium]
MLDSILHALHVFVDHLQAIGWGSLGIAVCLHLTKLAARTRAWRNILAAAHPGSLVRWRHAFGAYAAGAAVNAILPARGGDVVKLYLIRHRIAGSRYPTLAATLVVDTLFDFVVSGCLFLWALQQNVLPGIDVLGGLRSIDWSWADRHPRAALIAAGVVLLLLLVAVLLLRRRVEDFLRQLRAGGAILGQPRRYLRSVVLLQAFDWVLRIATIFFLLRAFGLPATLHNALLVQVTQSLSTLVPLTPGGIGTEQGLVVYVFSGKAAAAAVLAFSVGMKVALMTTNVVVGFLSIALMLRTWHVVRSVSDVRVRERGELADQRGGEEDQPESDLVEVP